jgi:hypothetical protein
LVLLTAIVSNAQVTKVVDVDKVDGQVVGNHFYMIGAEPVSTAKYVRVVSGSPFFSSSWFRGKVVMSGGRVYDSILLRLDLLDNTFQFVDGSGREMVGLATTVKSLILRDSLTGKQYEFDQYIFLQATNNIEPGWYQLLADGRAAAYKRIVKRMSETSPYGSATAEQIITDVPQHYLFVNSVFSRIKKFKDIPDLLSDKKDELNKFINSKNLSGKTDEDYKQLLNYYNSLF